MTLKLDAEHTCEFAWPTDGWETDVKIRHHLDGEPNLIRVWSKSFDINGKSVSTEIPLFWTKVRVDKECIHLDLTNFKRHGTCKFVVAFSILGESVDPETEFVNKCDHQFQPAQQTHEVAGGSYCPKCKYLFGV